MQLSRRLGLLQASALGTGAMVGAGIFVLSGVAAGLAGPAVIVSFIFAALLECLLGFCYAELASRYPRAGGPYVFVSETMGSLWGSVAGWCYWGSWLTASSFVARGFGNYLHALTGAPPLASAIVLLLTLGVLNILGVRLSGLVQLLVVIVEVALILVFVVGGLPHLHPKLYVPFAPHGFAGIVAATVVGFLSLTGWDGIVAAGEEIRHPSRTIPLAIFLAIAVVLLLYLALLLVALGTLSWNVLGAADAPISLVSQQLFGGGGPLFVESIIVLALVATANTFLFSLSRIAFAMGRTGIFPRTLAVIHPALGTPLWAVLLGVGLQIGITLLSSITTAISATGLLCLVSYTFTLLALFRVRMSKLETREDLFLVPFFPLLPALALAICLVLLFVVAGSGLVSGGIWIALGAVLLILRRNSLSAGEKREAHAQETRSGEESQVRNS